MLNQTKHFNLDLEMQLLGSILLSNNYLEFVLNLQILEPLDFYYLPHQKLISILIERHKNNLLTNHAILKKMFEENKELGGIEHLKQLYYESKGIFDIKSCALAVKELSTKRKIEAMLQGFIVNMESQEKTTLQIADDLTQSLQEVVYNLPTNSKPISLEDAISRVINDNNEESISLGYSNIDDLLNGVDLGSFVILAGRPSMGKSSVALNIAIRLAYQIPVLFLSLEVSNIQIAKRAMANLGDVALNEIRGKKPIAHAKELTAKQLSKNIKLTLKDTGGITLSMIRNEVKNFKAQGGKLLIIDYIQLIKHTGRKNGTTADDITAITNELKSLAMEYKIVIVGLSQLNRGVEVRENKRPMLSDLRSSGSLEQDADVVLFVHRPEYYIMQDQPRDENSTKFIQWQNDLTKWKNKAMIIIAKARDGKLGDCNFYVNFEKQQFNEIQNETYQGNYGE